MNRTDTAQVIVAIQAVNGKEPTREQAQVWHALLEPYTKHDAMTAIHTLSQTADYLSIQSIVHRIKRDRERRAERIGAISLNAEDEMSEDGQLVPGRGAKLAHLARIIRDGAITKADYEAYKAGTIALGDLGDKARRQLQ